MALLGAAKENKIKNCENCGSMTANPHFCSRSCYSKSQKKKAKQINCKFCGSDLPREKYSKRRTTCDACIAARTVDWSTVTYGEMKARRKHQIRALARMVYRQSGKTLKCEACGYDTHVVIHHKKSISSHSDDTSIAEINKLDNLMCLCPNHHWEIHNGCFYQ